MKTPGFEKKKVGISRYSLTILRKLPLNIRILCLTSIIEGVVSTGPLWALYINELKGSLAVVGSLMGLSSLCQMLFQIPGGIFSDHFGRKKAIVLGSLIRVFTLVYFALIPKVGLLVPGFIISSFASALIFPSRSALLAESTQSADRRKMYGLIDTMQSVTTIIGPALGLLIAGKFSIKAVFAVSALLSLITFILNVRLLEEKLSLHKTAGKKLKAFLAGHFAWMKDRNLNWLLVSQGISMLAASFAFPFFALFATKDIGIRKEQLSIIYLLQNLLLLLTRIPIGYLTDHPLIKKKPSSQEGAFGVPSSGWLWDSALLICIFSRMSCSHWRSFSLPGVR